MMKTGTPEPFAVTTDTDQLASCVVWGTTSLDVLATLYYILSLSINACLNLL